MFEILAGYEIPFLRSFINEEHNFSVQMVGCVGVTVFRTLERDVDDF